jgi:hypothetical protein
MENWQSEFLQLIWQVAGLAILWYVGSSQSKEGDERKEEKMDLIIKILDQKNGNAIIRIRCKILNEIKNIIIIISLNYSNFF